MRGLKTKNRARTTIRTLGAAMLAAAMLANASAAANKTLGERIAEHYERKAEAAHRESWCRWRWVRENAHLRRPATAVLGTCAPVAEAEIRRWRDERRQRLSDERVATNSSNTAANATLLARTRPVLELFASVIGGLGLFAAGMWFLTENLKTLASWRLRGAATRWTSNPGTALLWGALGGAVTQNMSALTFIVVSTLRSGLITTKGALAIILGASVGVTTLVLIVTLDVKTLALYVLGLAGFGIASARLSRYRPIAASCLGGAFIVLGLVLLKDGAAPLAEQPWFGELLAGTGESLLLAFLVAALLTALVQSSSAVCVIGISLASVGAISVDQTIMVIYGSCLGSSAILYLLSVGLTGRSRQVSMFVVWYNVVVCAVLVPGLYAEVYLDVPLMKALVLATSLSLEQQLAMVFVLLSVLPLPAMLAALNWSVSTLERIWPTSQADELSRPLFIHEHATVDVESALTLVALEQKRAMRDLTQYFEAVRRDEDIHALRAGMQSLLSDIGAVLDELQTLHPMHRVEERNTAVNRHKLLPWLEDVVGVLCKTLAERAEHDALEALRMSILESVDGVLFALIDAMESDDAVSWDMARQLTGDRSAMMRRVREQFLQSDPPLSRLDMINVLLITNTVEEIFFVLSKIEAEFNTHGGAEEHVPRP